YVSIGAFDGPVQPESERGPAGAILSHGDRSPRRGRAIRNPRRRDSQRRADDLYRGQRDPYGSRPRDDEKVQRARTNVRNNARVVPDPERSTQAARDRKSTRLNSSHLGISY